MGKTLHYISVLFHLNYSVFTSYCVVNVDYLYTFLEKLIMVKIFKNMI